MRCQFGKTWDNMKPWLVARRFREFDILNDLVRHLIPTFTIFIKLKNMITLKLQKNFPLFKDKMHPLPKKTLFGSMDSDTVAERTRNIVEYMCVIVTTLPMVSRMVKWSRVVLLISR